MPGAAADVMPEVGVDPAARAPPDPLVDVVPPPAAPAPRRASPVPPIQLTPDQYCFPESGLSASISSPVRASPRLEASGLLEASAREASGHAGEQCRSPKSIMRKPSAQRRSVNVSGEGTPPRSPRSPGVQSAAPTGVSQRSPRMGREARRTSLSATKSGAFWKHTKDVPKEVARSSKSTVQRKKSRKSLHGAAAADAAPELSGAGGVTLCRRSLTDLPPPQRHLPTGSTDAEEIVSLLNTALKKSIYAKEDNFVRPSVPFEPDAAVLQCRVAIPSADSDDEAPVETWRGSSPAAAVTRADDALVELPGLCDYLILKLVRRQPRSDRYRLPPDVARKLRLRLSAHLPPAGA